MSDLTEKTASGIVRVIGADASGNPTNFAQVTSDNALYSRDVGFSTGTSTRVAIATTSTQVLAANANRRYLYIANNGTVTLYLKFGSAAVSGQGYPLATGAVFTFNTAMWLGSIFAISGGFSSTLDVFEGTV